MARYSYCPDIPTPGHDEDDPLATDKSPVSILGLAASLTDKLEHHLLFTVGQLIMFLRRRRLTDIEGIGGERAGQVADAIADYRISYPKPPRKRPKR